MKKISFYIHIPFCKKKCLYCDFVSYEDCDEYMDEYFSALCEEIEAYNTILKEDYIIDTLYFGGGTPNYADAQYIEKITDVIYSNYNVDTNAEISMEINPCARTETEDFVRYKKCGINRLSIGLQSSSDDMLRQIGRQHTENDFRTAFKNARKAGFENINIDMIFGFHNQDVVEFENTVQYVLDCDCEHISCYSLKLEENTPLYEMYMNEGIDIENEDYENRMMYELACKMFEENGYKQYEISNFAKKGFECRHNINYWDIGEYIGFGTAAHSYKDKARFYNTPYIDEYIKRIKNNKSAIEEIEQIDKTKRQEEFIIMALRKTEGIRFDEFNKRFGKDFLQTYKNETEYLLDAGLIEIKNKSAYLTKEGKDFANIAMMEFISK